MIQAELKTLTLGDETMHQIKRSLLLIGLTAVLAAPFVSTSTNPTSAVTAAAKTTKSVNRQTLAKAIKRTPDLNKTSSVRHFSFRTYYSYFTLFNKNYNVQRMSKPTVFKHHQATVYVPSAELRETGYVTAAIKNWNVALGTKVFRIGTATNHTITVNMKDGPTSPDGSWDGYYQTNKVYVNANFYNNANYLPTVYTDLTGDKMAGASSPNSAAYQHQYKRYWTAVITHELGHSLGLDHTPYSNDIMASEFESAGSDFKYTWTDYKVVDNSFAILTGKLSTRDINRAKLTKSIGYW